MTTTRFMGITLQPSHTIGRAEFSGPGFRNPVAMVRGEEDTIYVLNRSYDYRPDGKRVTICTLDEDYIGEFARGVTTAGEGEPSDADGSLIWPTAIALDAAGNVYVADEWLNRISIFTSDGAYVSKWGSPGSGDGEISSPSGPGHRPGRQPAAGGLRQPPGAEVHEGRPLHLPVRRQGRRRWPVQHALGHHRRPQRRHLHRRLAQRSYPEVRPQRQLSDEVRDLRFGRRAAGPPHRGGGGQGRLHLRDGLGQRPSAGLHRPRANT